MSKQYEAHSLELLNRALDHALGSLDSEDALIPFVMAMKADGSIALNRFAAETLEGSVEHARHSLHHLPAGVVAYALAYDGYLTLEETRYEAVLLEVGYRDAPTAVEYGQPYARGETGQKPTEIGNVKTLGFPPNAFSQQHDHSHAEAVGKKKKAFPWRFAVAAFFLAALAARALFPDLGEGKSGVPYAEIWVTEDYTINRTALEHGQDVRTLTWVIQSNGVTQLERLAENETQYRHRVRPGNNYTVYLKAFFDGKYHTVSNVVHFTPQR